MSLTPFSFRCSLQTNHLQPNLSSTVGRHCGENNIIGLFQPSIAMGYGDQPAQSQIESASAVFTSRILMPAWTSFDVSNRQFERRATAAFW